MLVLMILTCLWPLRRAMQCGPHALAQAVSCRLHRHWKRDHTYTCEGSAFWARRRRFFFLIWINYYEFIEYRHSYSVIYGP